MLPRPRPYVACRQMGVPSCKPRLTVSVKGACWLFYTDQNGGTPSFGVAGHDIRAGAVLVRPVAVGIARPPFRPIPARAGQRRARRSVGDQ
jgi:hypothetical protein